MKKLLFLFVVMMLSIFSYSFPHGSDSCLLNIGSSSFSGVMDKPAEMGINCAFSINRLHFDLSSNVINDNRSMDLSVANVGYIFPVNFMVSFIPVLGLGISDGNHAGSYHCDIFHSNENTYYCNAGFLFLMKLGKKMGFYTGIGTFESFRMGITFALK
jgi:hypothetical protein